MTQADPARIKSCFTDPDGGFRFARWRRAPRPVVFGSDETGAEIFGAALRRAAALTGLADAPARAPDYLVFFCNDWAELRHAPDLEKLIPGRDGLITRLEAAQANQYRLFGFERGEAGPGAIDICVTLLRYDAGLRAVPAPALALDQAVRSLLLWAEGAFRADPPVALAQGEALIKPWCAALLRAAYDPVLPDRSMDASMALRIAARMRLVRETKSNFPSD